MTYKLEGFYPVLLFFLTQTILPLLGCPVLVLVIARVSRVVQFDAAHVAKFYTVFSPLIESAFCEYTCHLIYKLHRGSYVEIKGLILGVPNHQIIHDMSHD